ncbi:OST-HTH/LOTUS domain-containing protein [Arthrobacter sp. MPF02]|uniref:OST-HTH/LOTUS domain-containing protein n=1 Tax=Arthrobacter sp. MPF02 TaxID=3388492 RepID=UPI003984DA17
MRILADGLKVYGFGQRKTPEPFVNACSLFTYVEGLGQSSASPETLLEERTDPRTLRGNTRLVLMMRNTVEAARGDDGWANFSAVRSQIGNQASLDPRNYGHRKLNDLFETTGLFDVRRKNQRLLVRDKRSGARGTPVVS